MFRKIIFLAFLFPTILFSSECYHYHTKIVYSIDIFENEPYIIASEIDPNGISIASQEFWKLDISTQDLKIVDPTLDGGVIISNADALFWFDKNPYTFSDRGLLKIIEKDKVQRIFTGNTYQINGEWKLLEVNIYEEKVSWKYIENFPKNPSLLAHYAMSRDQYLITGDDFVYTFSNTTGICEKIDGLDAKTTTIYPKKENVEHQFLYDADSFYITDYYFQNFTDISTEIQSKTQAKNFVDFDFFYSEYAMGFSPNANEVYSFIQAGYDSSTGEYNYFFPLKNSRWLDNCKLIQVGNNYYNFGQDAMYEMEEIDVTAVENVEKLYALPYELYSDSINLYFLEYEAVDAYGFKKYFKKLNPENANLNPAKGVKFYYGVQSYNNYTSPFILNQNQMIDWNLMDKIFTKRKEIKTEIKDLKIAYAYDNKLLIENKEIENIADFKSLELVGSTVEVINPCDGGNGQMAVEVEYYYFFKDKNSVFRYHTGDEKLTKIASANDAKTEVSFTKMQQWQTI